MASILADTIRGELIKCPVCLETFEDPRQLNCRHSFCFTCIKAVHTSSQNTGVVVCPMCRGCTNVPAGGLNDLKSDITIKGLLDLMQTQANKSENGSQNQDTDISTCSNCGHVKGASRNQLQKSSRKLASNDKHVTFCCKHPKEKLKYFCDTCKVKACTSCVILQHKSHFVIQNV